jgi:hypothetical protein
MSYPIKQVSCEWQLVEQEVNQYGFSEGGGKVLESFPSYEEAKNALPLFGKKHSFVDRWIPHNAKHDYVELQIQYREIPFRL